MHDFFSLPFSLQFEITELLIVIISIILIATCVKMVFSKNLLELIIIMSIFSLSIGICYLFMDAPDVAMTETALGASLSTCVLLNLVNIVGNKSEAPKRSKIILAVILCMALAICLTIASLDLYNFGEENSRLQSHLTKYYVENTREEIAIPSLVAAILASYRGFDTLGETTVILLAGLAVLSITSRKKKE